MNNVKIKKFLGMEVRIVNEEYIVLKDVFSALGRLDNKNQIVSTDRNKLKKIIGSENILKFKIYSKTTNSKSREFQEMYCIKFDLIDKFNLINIFKSNLILYERFEIKFINKLEESLKPFNIKGEKQYIVKNDKGTNYRIDYYIPSLNIAIEYDEDGHKGYSYEAHEGRQDYIENKLGCKFIRVSDKNSDEYNIGFILKNIFILKYL